MWIFTSLSPKKTECQNILLLQKTFPAHPDAKDNFGRPGRRNWPTGSLPRRQWLSTRQHEQPQHWTTRECPSSHWALTDLQFSIARFWEKSWVNRFILLLFLFFSVCVCIYIYIYILGCPESSFGFLCLRAGWMGFLSEVADSVWKKAWLGYHGTPLSSTAGGLTEREPWWRQGQVLKGLRNC